MWQNALLIPKVNGHFNRIGLVKVLWKMVVGFMNLHITSTIDFHDTLNGFCAGQVTGTTSLKDKILHQMTPIREEFLYEIFLGLHNVYDALD